MVKGYATKASLADLLNDPFLIGFGREIDRLSSIHKTNSSLSYPPYNVLKYDHDNYALELAVAGFRKDEIDVTVKDNTLIITGERLSPEVEDYYIHRGIATRKFTRSFALGEFMEIKGAEMENGILSIQVERIVPEEKKPKAITIK